MRRDVWDIPLVVPVGGIDALHDGDVVCGHWDVVTRRDPVLRARVAVTPVSRRESRDDIIGMGDAIQGAARLCGQEFCKCPVTDAGRAI